MELLISIAIMGIIVGPIGGAIIIGLRTTDATSNRINSSRDAQLVAVYLPADVQSTSDDIVVGGGNTDCSGQPNVVRLRWKATEGLDGVEVTYTAAYAITAGGESGWRLVRYYCVGGGGPQETVVARNLQDGAAGVAAQDGATVSMTLREAPGGGDPTVFTYTVSGTRRSA